MEESKNDKKSVGSIKEYYQRLRKDLLYSNMLSLVEKYSFDSYFKKQVLTNMELCQRNGSFEVENNQFIGEYVDIDGEHKFILTIKFPRINFEIKSVNAVYHGSLFYSKQDKSYVCYKWEEIEHHTDFKDGINNPDYDTYNVTVDREVLLFDSLKNKIGRYEEKTKENFAVNKYTKEKVLNSPNAFENYIQTIFSYKNEDNHFVRKVKVYNHSNFENTGVPLENTVIYFKGKAEDINLLWKISGEDAKKLNFPSDDEIKQYQKLLIS